MSVTVEINCNHCGIDVDGEVDEVFADSLIVRCPECDNAQQVDHEDPCDTVDEEEV